MRNLSILCFLVALFAILACSKDDLLPTALSPTETSSPIGAPQATSQSITPVPTLPVTSRRPPNATPTPTPALSPSPTVTATVAHVDTPTPVSTLPITPRRPPNTTPTPTPALSPSPTPKATVAHVDTPEPPSEGETVEAQLRELLPWLDAPPDQDHADLATYIGQLRWTADGIDTLESRSDWPLGRHRLKGYGPCPLPVPGQLDV